MNLYIYTRVNFYMRMYNLYILIYTHTFMCTYVRVTVFM